MGAGGAFLASWKGARVLSSFVGSSADSTSGVIAAKGSRMTISLALSALGASSVGDVVVQLAFAVANYEVLAADGYFLDIACKRHDNGRVRFVLTPLGCCKPTWRLTLYQLRVIGSNAG
jgi:hypothetical protein